jgi:hypothetical protein
MPKSGEPAHRIALERANLDYPLQVFEMLRSYPKEKGDGKLQESKTYLNTSSPEESRNGAYIFSNG